MKNIPFILVLFVAGLTFGVDKPKVAERSSGFLENKGQIIDQNDQLNPNVLFLLHGKGLSVQLRKKGFSYDIYEPTPNADSIINFHRIDIDFENLNPAFEVVTEKPSDDYLNYYTTGTTESGATHVRSFEQVTYSNIYPGIDIVFYANASKSGFKYDFVVHPGADSRQIRLRYKGMNDLPQIAENALTLSSRFGTFTEKIPSAFFKENNESVQVSFGLEGNLVTYDVKSGDPTKTLIIDPVPNRLWCSYYGGSGSDLIRTMSSSPDGNSVSCVGWTTSSGNIATSGSFKSTYTSAEDGFLFRMNINGQRIWATYIGGTGNDRAYHVVSDPSSNLYVSGETYSSSFSVTTGAFQTTFGGGNDDAYVAKFDSSGKRVWTTFYGGNGWDEAYRIVFDRTNYLYIAGKTSSTNKIATSGRHQTSIGGGEDGFVAKFDTSGKRIWGTYYGGSGAEYVNGITSDIYTTTDFYITGTTNSSNAIASTGAYQTTFGGAYDIYLACFDSSGQRKWSTYYGGTQLDYTHGNTVDSFGASYVYGYCESNGLASTGAFKTTLSGTRDGIVIKFNKSGQRLWATYYGGTGVEELYQADFFLRGYIVVVGYSTSTTGISTTGAWQTSKSTGDDGFIAKFNGTSGQRVWGTYFGSTGSDKVLAVSLIKDKVYIAGLTTSTSGFVTTGAHQTTFGGTQDGFIARFDDDPCFLFSIGITRKDILCKGSKDGSIAITPKDGVYPYLYTVGTASPVTDSIVKGLDAGLHKVLVVDANGCRDSLFTNINEPPVAFDLTLDAATMKVCTGSDKGLAIAKGVGGNAPYTYVWNASPPQNTDTAKSLKAGVYQAMGTDKNGCKDSAVFTVTESPLMVLKIDSFRDISCFNGLNGFARVSVTGGTQPLQYSWNTNPPQLTDSAVNLSIGYYKVNVTDSVGCQDTNALTLKQPTQLKVTFAEPDMIICQGSNKGYAQAKGAGGTGTYSYTWNTTPKKYTDTINGLFAGTYQATLLDQNGCKDSAVYTVSEVSSMSTIVDSLRNVSCNGGNDGYVKVSVSGGKKPFNYLWSSSPAQNTDSATKLLAGYYKFTVTDSIGCQDTVGVTVSEPAALRVTLDAASMLICTAQSNGLGHAKGAGGTAPYNFSWNSSPAQNTDTAKNLTAGVYKVMLTDLNSCKDSTVFTVIESPKMIPTLALQRNVTCFGGNNGFTKVSVSGGTNPLKYVWSGNPSQSADSAVNLGTGNYTCQISDSIGCQDSLTATVTQPAAALSVQPTIINESCDDAKDGEISISVSGGTKPYFYSWNTSPAQTNNIAVNLAEGNYTVVVTDSNGCNLSADYAVASDNALPPLTLQSDTTICLETEITINLIQHRNMTFLWNDTDTASVKTFSEAGLYSVTAFHSCGDQTASFLLTTRNCSCFVHIPNAFTPSQDLLNETFKPFINCQVRDYTMKIFNRWGEVIFTSMDVEKGWTGVYLDKSVPQTAYFYMIDFVGSDGIMEQLYHFKGMITVLR